MPFAARSMQPKLVGLIPTALFGFPSHSYFSAYSRRSVCHASLIGATTDSVHLRLRGEAENAA